MENKERVGGGGGGGGNPNFENFGIPNLRVPRKMTFGCNPCGQSQKIL